jgi:glycosyltransferase involved in cell wall biosynthesis
MSSELLEVEAVPSTSRDLLSVVHVVLSMDAGGLERIVLDLLSEAPHLNQRASVLCLERPGAWAEAAQSLGAAVVCANKPPGFHPRLIGRLTHTLADLRPDVLHTHQVGAMFYAAPAARRAGVRAVLHTEHGKHYTSRARTRWLGRLAARNLDRFFCVSRDIADEVRRCRIVHPGKIDVVPNGIDVGRFGDPPDPVLQANLGIPAGAPVIGTLGRLSEVKRQDLLLHAFAEVRHTSRDAHLLIVGDGPLRRDLAQMAQTLGIASLVHFAGYQQEPQRFLALMNVFVLTSRSEGMPLSVLEAWAAGLPVVTSAVGGLPEMIGPSKAGMLFPSGDVAALAARLCDLLASEPTQRAMGQRGREIVRESYSLQRMAADYDHRYRLLLGDAE